METRGVCRWSGALKTRREPNVTKWGPSACAPGTGSHRTRQPQPHMTRQYQYSSKATWCPKSDMCPKNIDIFYLIIAKPWYQDCSFSPLGYTHHLLAQILHKLHQLRPSLVFKLLLGWPQHLLKHVHQRWSELLNGRLVLLVKLHHHAEDWLVLLKVLA